MDPMEMKKSSMVARIGREEQAPIVANRQGILLDVDERRKSSRGQRWYRAVQGQESRTALRAQRAVVSGSQRPRTKDHISFCSRRRETPAKDD